MRAVLQRVSRASVAVDGAVVGEIGAGLMILFCAMQGDEASVPVKLACRLPPSCALPVTPSVPVAASSTPCTAMVKLLVAVEPSLDTALTNTVRLLPAS